MKKLIIVIAILALMVPSLWAANWEIDPGHSNVGFVVSHMVVTKVKGQFKTFSGMIKDFDGKDFSKASVEVIIDPKSISTDNERRDNHLKSSDFFAADSLPNMGFKSKKIVPGKDNNFQIVGDLTMRGVTKEVTLDATFNGSVQAGPSTRGGFSASTKINRQDWGISWSKTLDAGGMVAGNEVTILLEVEAVQQK